MRYKYIILALVVAAALPASVSVYALSINPVEKSDIYTAAGKATGATCDVQQAYNFLASRTSSRYKHSINKLDPEFACRLERFFKATGCGFIFSGVRTKADQARISGNSNNTGRPGVNSYTNSCHSYGLAVDVSGCYEYRSVMSKYGLHLPYSSKSHIQCVEHTRPSCSPQTKTCAGGVARRSIEEISGQNKYQSTNASQPQKQPTQTSQPPPSRTSQTPSSSNNSNTGSNSIWDSKPKPEEVSKNAATLTCKPGTISGTERALIEWSCGGDSTHSRGATTSLKSRFNTQGRLGGRGYARPGESVSYKVQCVAGSKVVGEATCRVNVAGDSEATSAQSGTTSTNSRVVLHLSTEVQTVDWGTGTTLQWASIGADNCTVTGNNMKKTGESGFADTGELYSLATYVLKCDTTQGSKSIKAEVRIR